MSLQPEVIELATVPRYILSLQAADRVHEQKPVQKKKTGASSSHPGPNKTRSRKQGKALPWGEIGQQLPGSSTFSVRTTYSAGFTCCSCLKM